MEKEVAVLEVSSKADFLAGNYFSNLIFFQFKNTNTCTTEAKTFVKLGRHPRLVRYHGICTEGGGDFIFGTRHACRFPGKHRIITEFASRGSLMSSLEEIEFQLTYGHKLVMLQQICSGMEVQLFC